MLERLILHNANIVALDDALPHATAIVLRPDKIEYVGDDAGALAYKESDSRIIDAHGRLGAARLYRRPSSLYGLCPNTR